MAEIQDGYNRRNQVQIDLAEYEAKNAQIGALKDEIVPVKIQRGKVEHEVTNDEQPGRASEKKIHSLKPAFAKDGTITAANTSSISDGASALVLADADYAQTLQVEPIAFLVGHARHSLQPSDFTLAPINAIKKVAKKVHWNLNDVDLFEINEAFAMVAILAMRELNIDHSKVNVYGGACAQGHPIGSTGSRIIITLVNALRRFGKKKGIASLCIGGGEATAMAIELPYSN